MKHGGLKMNQDKVLIIIGVFAIVSGIAMNLWAMQKFQDLREFETECNEHYQKVFARACMPQPGFIGWQPTNWTLLNLTTTTLTPS